MQFQALQKHFSNLAIDLWNLSRQFVNHNRTGADALESFMNARYYAKTLYKQSDGHLFAAEDQLRAVDEINSALAMQQNVIDKFRRSEGNFSALKSLASVGGVPELLRSRIFELARVVPLIRAALTDDLKWRHESAKFAPLASEDESVVLVVSWKDSALVYTALLDRLHALIV